jgi:GNAT superfamily N-acetyltransferase
MGYVATLPRGAHVQATRTYLELTEPSAFREAFGHVPDLLVGRVAQPTPELYRFCYRTVGEAYHWRDRWDWSDEQIRAHLAQPGIAVHVATQNEQFIGWYELRHVEDGSVEIAYFGLAPDAIGRGLGRHLLSCAVRDAWTSGASRVWVHTCTLDHPHALDNYRSRGFVPYRTEQYEVT